MKKKINIIIVCSIALLAFSIMAFNKQYKSVYYGDSMGYYSYLPATFISQQLKEPAVLPDTEVLSETRIQTRNYLSQIYTTPNGNFLNQYTYGVALFESPFFFIAHAFEKLTNRPAEGYDLSYKIAIRASTLFYAILGLYLLYLSLKKFFDTTHTLLGLGVLILGTNFLWFALIQSGMAHIIIFFLVSCLILLSIKIYEKPSLWLFLLIGFTVGFIMLIRPTDILFVAIPILFYIHNWDSFKKRLGFFGQHKFKILLSILVAGIPIIPQLLYWKLNTGQYLFYSYGEQGFDWKHPHILAGLFSFKNGWIVYSPVVLLSIIGIVFYKQLKAVFLIIILTLPVYIYVVYAWYCYNYINGLGSRPMIHFYPLLAFPLVALIQYVSQQKLLFKIPFAAIVLLLCSVSYSYSIQQMSGTLWSENSTKTFNLSTMYRYKLNYNDLVCFDNEIIQPDTQKLQFLKTLKWEHYEKDSSKNVFFDSLIKSYVYHIKPGVEYPERLIEITYNQYEHGNAKWLKCSGQFYAPENCEIHKQNIIVLEVKRGDEMRYWTSCSINNKIGLAEIPLPTKGFTLFELRTKIWGSVQFFAPIPKNIQNGDKIRMIIWGIGKRELIMDNLKLELYK